MTEDKPSSGPNLGDLSKIKAKKISPHDPVEISPSMETSSALEKVHLKKTVEFAGQFADQPRNG